MTNTFDRLNQVLWEAANGPIPDDILDQPADDNDTIATLQAENARLREALIEIINHASATRAVVHIARAALGAEKPTP